MGHKIGARIQPGHIDGTPSLLPCLCNQNESNQDKRHCFFNHQYITNPTLSPESHVVAAAQQLATALKGTIPAGNETAEALTKVSELFTKIAAEKQAAAAAKEQRNRLRAHPAARSTTHLPRVEAPPPRVDVPFPRVTETPGWLSRSADCPVPNRATAS